MGGDIGVKHGNVIYPNYDVAAKIIKDTGVPEDFASIGPVRYTHRTADDWDIYFVSNRTGKNIKTTCNFRTKKGTPELWIR